MTVIGVNLVAVYLKLYFFVSIFVLSLVKLPYGPGDKKHLMFQDVTG